MDVATLMWKQNQTDAEVTQLAFFSIRYSNLYKVLSQNTVVFRSMLVTKENVDYILTVFKNPFHGMC